MSDEAMERERRGGQEDVNHPKKRKVSCVKGKEKEWIACGFELLEGNPTIATMDEVIKVFSELCKENPGWKELSDALAVVLTDRALNTPRERPEDKKAVIEMLERAMKCASREDKAENARRFEKLRVVENELWLESFWPPYVYGREKEYPREVQEWFRKYIEPTRTYRDVCLAYQPPEEMFHFYLCEIEERLLDGAQSEWKIPIVRIRNCPVRMLSWLRKIFMDCQAACSQAVLADEIDEPDNGNYWLCTWFDKGGENLRKEIETYFSTSKVVSEVEKLKWQMCHGCFILHSEDEVISMEIGLDTRRLAEK